MTGNSGEKRDGGNLVKRKGSSCDTGKKNHLANKKIGKGEPMAIWSRQEDWFNQQEDT